MARLSICTFGPSFLVCNSKRNPSPRFIVRAVLACYSAFPNTYVTIHVSKRTVSFNLRTPQPTVSKVAYARKAPDLTRLLISINL